MADWEVKTIGSLGEVITGKTPSKNNPEDWGEELPFITPSDYKNYRKFAKTSDRYLSHFGVERFNNKVLPTNSILVTCIGSDMGKVVMNKIPAVTNQQINSISPDIKIIDADFLYYSLMDLYGVLRMLGGDGTAVPIVNKSDFENIEVKFPPLPEQKAIASVLSSLDDKIDLLHSQNKTLEAMAETLFRQWFGKEADDECEMGNLGDLIEVKYGKDHKKLLDGNIPVFGSGGIMRYAEKALYERESVLIPRKGTLSNVIYINEPFWTVDTMFFTKMKRPNLAKFIYHFVKGQDLTNMNVGSAVPSMTTQVLNNIQLSIPTNKILEDFENKVSSMYSKIKANRLQINSLEKIRDTLLPKLMSGDVRVSMD